MSNKKQYFLIEYIFSVSYYDEGKEMYLCKNEEKAIKKINEIIDRINGKIKVMCDDENKNINNNFSKVNYTDYIVKKITNIKKFELNDSYNYYDCYDYIEFDYKIKVTEVFNNDGIITLYNPNYELK